MNVFIYTMISTPVLILCVVVLVVAVSLFAIAIYRMMSLEKNESIDFNALRAKAKIEYQNRQERKRLRKLLQNMCYTPPCMGNPSKSIHINVDINTDTSK